MSLLIWSISFRVSLAPTTLLTLPTMPISAPIIILFLKLIYGFIDLIVVKETDKKFLDRLDEFYLDASPLDILVYTPEEVDEMKERPFIKRAMKEGQILPEA